MWKIFSIIITIVVTSFYFFPFSFTFLPEANTKMVLAGAGLVLLIVNLASGRKAKINTDFLILSALALGVSFSSFISMTINNTPDGEYLTYIVSMWVWLGGAYFVANWIRKNHDSLSVELVCCYLIAVGVCQCLLAVLIDQFVIVKAIVDSFLYGTGFMGKVDGRLYGIGCALDVAGGRFAIMLIMIAYMLPKMLGRQKQNLYIILLSVAYCIIAVIGSMIGRTTIVGIALSSVYLLYYFTIERSLYKNVNKTVLLAWLSGVLVVVILVFVNLYNKDIYWREQLRFGFEGFFSLAEKGRWEVHSNEMLKEGLIFPDNLKTWLIGDAYIGDPYNNPYYVGEASYGFYMNTDAGYSRFLFYFGLVGLLSFSIFMIKSSHVCMMRFKSYRMMFFLILLLNFAIWVKVTTDIFLVFALFLCIPQEDNDAYENSLSDPLDI